MANEPDPDCRRITDFGVDAVLGDDGWFVVDDGVMGGRSKGTADIADSVLRFSGTLVTDDGGFTSVRCRVDGDQMAGTSRLSMRVRADERIYGVTLKDDTRVGQRSVSHRARLDTTGPVDADGWMVTTLRYTELEPTVFGRSVDAPSFRASAARQIGIIIADDTDGDFSLEVDWIDVCD